MKTLLDLLHKAGAISIDDEFVRYFNLEMEDCEEPEDIQLDADTDTRDHFFTVEEIENAKYNPKDNSWEVKGFDIKCYKVKEIKP